MAREPDGHAVDRHACRARIEHDGAMPDLRRDLTGPRAG
jgi:hypothetical protein